MRPLIAVLLIGVLQACTSRGDLIAQKPILNEVFEGDYQAIAGCQVIKIQEAWGTGYPFTTQYIPVANGAEVQTLQPNNPIKGTTFFQVTRYEDLGDGSFRASIRSNVDIDNSKEAVALRSCVTEAKASIAAQ